MKCDTLFQNQPTAVSLLTSFDIICQKQVHVVGLVWGFQWQEMLSIFDSYVVLQF